MDELLQQVADKTGVPADMLERSAQARAEAEGTTVEAVLAGWAGVPVPEAGAAPAAAAPGPGAEPAPAAETEAPAEVSVEVLEPEAPPPEAAPEEPEEESEQIPVGPGMPRWLSAAFVVVPFVAILYALIAPNGPDCGNAGSLDIDPVTGTAVNCDGSEYGSVAGFFGAGEGLYEDNCASCHGANGGGVSAPALAGGAVVETFSVCADHIEWVTLGNQGYPGNTYGDQNKPKSDLIMPSFGDTLEVLEIAAVVLFERVAFGRLDLAAAEEACGLSAEVAVLGG